MKLFATIYLTTVSILVCIAIYMYSATVTLNSIKPHPPIDYHISIKSDTVVVYDCNDSLIGQAEYKSLDSLILLNNQ